MQKTIPIVISTIHDPGGVTRRGAIANLDEIVSTGQSPSAIYKTTEERYWTLVEKLRPIISKTKFSKEDWTTIGEAVSKFQDDLKNFSPSFGFEVINLAQAVAEDLDRDVNTIQAYLFYAKSHQNNQNLPEGSPDEAVLQSLRAGGRPMTPTQISLASGVNYNTVRRVVQELLRDGKVARTRARGVYIAS
jgi:IclR helix-turn-helix domain